MNAVESLQVKRAGSREGWNLRVGGMAMSTIVWIGALASLFPLLWTVVSSFRPGQSFLVSPFVFTPLTEYVADVIHFGSLIFGVWGAYATWRVWRANRLAAVAAR